jgi:hypothetical protein
LISLPNFAKRFSDIDSPAFADITKKEIQSRTSLKRRITIPSGRTRFTPLTHYFSRIQERPSAPRKTRESIFQKI